MTFLLFLLFVTLPIIEIALLIKLGSWIGFWATLAIVIGTAVLGTFLLRQQGLSVLMRTQQELDQGKLPVQAVFDGVFLLVSGALLLTPGIVTDAFGFLLLFPPFRKVAASYLLKKASRSGKFSVSGFHMETENDHDVKAGGFHFETGFSSPKPPGSPDTKRPSPSKDASQNTGSIQDAEILEEIPAGDDPDDTGTKTDRTPPTHKSGSPWKPPKNRK